MRVTNEEFIATLHGHMFTNQNRDANKGHVLDVHKLPINPGDGRMFPWLSAVARRYEHYKFTSLELVYKPATSTLTSGNVAMCPIYDPADTVPTTRTVLLNTDGVVRTQVYNQASLKVPTSRLNTNKKLYIRSQGDHVMDPGELRNTDLGFIVLTVTDSGTTTSAFGDIFVRYSVEFHGPRIGASGSRVGHSDTRIGRATVKAKDGLIAPFGNVMEAQGERWTRKHNSVHNTLDYTIGYDDEIYDYAGTGGGAATLVKFEEPFTGIMTIKRQHDLTTGSFASHLVNGQKGYEHDGSAITKPGQSLQSGRVHDWRTGIANFVGLVKDAGDAIQETWSVICDVGDVLHISGTGGVSVNETTSLTLLEAAEDILPVIGGLLLG